MTYLVDTNVLSELARPRVDVHVAEWARRVWRVSVSVVTVEEVVYGLSWRPNSRVQEWIDGFLQSRCDVLPITSEIASWAGRLRGRLRARGMTRSQADMLIAATAAVHDLTLVTRNTNDFVACGIALLNPFH